MGDKSTTVFTVVPSGCTILLGVLNQVENYPWIYYNNYIYYFFANKKCESAVLNDENKLTTCLEIFSTLNTLHDMSHKFDYFIILLYYSIILYDMKYLGIVYFIKMN